MAFHFFIFWNFSLIAISSFNINMFYHVMSLQLVTDVNLAVSVEAIQAIGNLARGLRAHFSGSSRFLLPILLVSYHIASFGKIWLFLFFLIFVLYLPPVTQSNLCMVIMDSTYCF